MIKFKKQNPKKLTGEWYLVRCPKYCQSGYQIARWNGKDWETEYETITEWVTGCAELEVKK